MKIRKGFVSNSSSSSYLILGFPLEENEDLLKVFKKYLEEGSDINTSEGIEDLYSDCIFYTGDSLETSLYGKKLAYWDYYEEDIDVRPDTQAYLLRNLVELTKKATNIDISKNRFRVVGVTISG